MGQRVLIDCDPGIDDALALYAALASETIELAAITTVFGNGPVSQATRNVARLLRLVPHRPTLRLAEGSDEPLTGSRLPRRAVHGHDGLGDVGIPVVPAARSLPGSTTLIAELLKANAVDAMVALGPLTNLAHAFAASPTLVRRLRSITVMGGVIVDTANATATEFNLASDPAAARCLLQGRLPLRWVPLHVAASVAVDRDAVEHFQAAHGRSHVGRTIAHLLTAVMRLRGSSQGAVIPDAVAFILALDPSAGTWRQRRLTLEGRSRSGRLQCELGVPNVQVCEAVNGRRVLESLWNLWGQLASRTG